jgi:hypothetical protein
VQFYLSQGWQIAREFAHEKYHHAMLEMAKSLPEVRAGPILQTQASPMTKT